ncbi:hypothetical protein [uncultured Microbulbifer sp.]|uniref:hypothetical protein n=1 Tax=uncultured Microbulbifer sp. TaxID=348147 RepID=UPI00262B5571|nr:hypothetical protein [uncultured Microbulbifer sp.]
MSVQQKFQIVSAGKVLRSKNPAEVLAQMSSAFSIPTQQARKLFVKGWVIKDELSSGQVVQYRTQLHQIGLKIEVHPAGKFDNRAILARMQFAQKRKVRAPSAQPANVREEKVRTPVDRQANVEVNLASNLAPNPQANGNGVAALKKRPPEKIPPKEPSARDQAESSARKQLEALFCQGETHRLESDAQPLGLLPALASAALVPVLFAGALVLILIALGGALWSVPAAILAGTFGAGVVAGAAAKLLLIALIGCVFFFPYISAGNLSSFDDAGRIRLRKQDAPGLFLLLEVLEAKTGLSIAGKLAGPKNLTAAKQARGTLVEVTSGAEVVVEKSAAGQLTLSLGLGAIAGLNGGEVLALAARAMSYHQGPLVRIAMYCSLVTAQKLQAMQDALESEKTLLNTAGEPAALLKPFHKVLAACGLVLVPVIERLQGLHRATSGALARRLEKRADAVAAQMIGSDVFASFSERWNHLVHAGLVCGEINREAQLTGRCLRDFPRAVLWLYQNLDEVTRNSIELSMGEDTDCWSQTEPAGHERIAEVEDRQIPALLQRQDFSVQKLFADFDELCVSVSRQGADETCRAVENQQLLTASKEVEAAQRVLSEYFNRAIPRDFLSLRGPENAELAGLGLQETIDWLRTRLIELQEQEQRLAQLQLRGARIQLGAALVRANVRVDPRSYDLSGTTPSAAEASRKDNRARVQECMQQRQQLHKMFFQRVKGAMATMPSADRGAASGTLEQLKGFEGLRESVGSLNGCGDLVSEMIERIPSADVPVALVQKYAQLAVQQIRQVYQLAVKQPGLLPQALLEKLEACGAGAGEIPPSSRSGDLVGALQGLELRCKNASAVVFEGYQNHLARLLGLCLAEEARRKVKPLRLVGTV